ncbi:Snf7-domain-containing protein [Phlyctochytrium arcticum]|nr:Snf7-domain-containing protein [Phlyctochytrium arcticum]
MSDPLANGSRPASIDEYLSRYPFWSATDQKSNDKASFLFASFPPTKTTLNSPAWDEKITFWKTVILDCARYGLLNQDPLVFESVGLESKFQRRGLRPRGLDVVLTAMHEGGDLVNVEQFLQSTERTTWMNWVLDAVVINNLPFSVQKLLGRSRTNESAEAKLASMSLLREISERLLVALRKDVHYASDHILGLDEFQDKMDEVIKSSVGLSPKEQDSLILQALLTRKGHATFLADPDTVEKGRLFKFPLLQIVKLKPLRGSSGALEVTSSDKGIIRMRTTQKTLHLQVDDLEAKIVELTKSAQRCLQNKQRERALYYLRQKKFISSIISKRIGSIETLDNILGKIQSAETEAEVLNAYQAGTDSLKTLIKTSGLTVDVVESTMDALEEALADQTEIENAMEYGQNQITANIADDEDLELELEALLLSELENLPAPENKLPGEEEGLGAVQPVPASNRTPDAPRKERAALYAT